MYLWPLFIKDTPTELLGEPNTNVTFIKWSTTHPILSMGLDNGGITMFNKRTQKKMPVPTKHGKAVVDGDWNQEGLLLTVAQDKSIIITRHTGENSF